MFQSEMRMKTDNFFYISTYFFRKLANNCLCTCLVCIIGCHSKNPLGVKPYFHHSIMNNCIHPMIKKKIDLKSNATKLVYYRWVIAEKAISQACTEKDRILSQKNHFVFFCVKGSFCLNNLTTVVWS